MRDVNTIAKLVLFIITIIVVAIIIVNNPEKGIMVGLYIFIGYVIARTSPVIGILVYLMYREVSLINNTDYDLAFIYGIYVATLFKENILQKLFEDKSNQTNTGQVK